MNAGALIDALGGTTAVARLLDVKPPSVSEWRAREAIPLDKLIRLACIAEARGVGERKQLVPDKWAQIWPELVDHASA